MQPIIRPPAPLGVTPSYREYARLLGNDVGRFCSFCERAVMYRLMLFHKQRGVLSTSARLSSRDWPSLFLICPECAETVTHFDARADYFWPDSTEAGTYLPFLYRRVDDVPVSWKDAAGNEFPLPSVSVIQVQIDTDVPDWIQTAARTTYDLFRLNGRFFNENFSQPAYVLTEDEYIHPSDTRLDDRWDSYVRAVDAGQALARAMQTISMGGGYIRGQLAMISLSAAGFGFISTWNSTIDETLNAANPHYLPSLVALLKDEAPPRPSDRKRPQDVVNAGIKNAPGSDRKRRRELDERFNALIRVSS